MSTDITVEIAGSTKRNSFAGVRVSLLLDIQVILFMISLIFLMPCVLSAATGDISYTINATADVDGSIAPSGATTVPAGGSAPFTITADPNYQVRSVIVDGNNKGAITLYTFSNVNANHTINAYFKMITYTLTASATTGGSISPPGTNVVNIGSSRTFAITPKAGYNVADVQVDGVSQGAVATYTFTNVQTNHTISATIVPNAAYIITATESGSGTISPSGSVSVPGGAKQTFTMTPSTGYRVDSFAVDGATIESNLPTASYTFANVQTTHTISVTFVPATYTVTAAIYNSDGTAGSGAITPAGTMTVNHGTSVTYTITPNTGYACYSVIIDGTEQAGGVTSYTFNSVAANHTINAYLKMMTYTLTASAGAGGSINPSGTSVVYYGASQTDMITPTSGYYIVAVQVDGQSVGAVTSYMFTNIQANHTITASFAIITSTVTYVTYNGNGNTGGSVPVDSTNYQQGQTVTVVGNTGNLVNTGDTFAGWNTQANGSGTTYTQGQTFTMGTSNVTLYAMWTATTTTGNVPRFAYVANNVDKSVSTYALDATTGRLKFAGKVAVGNMPLSVTIDPSGKYVYVTNYFLDGTVSQYTIGANGDLTPMTPATVAAGNGPYSITVDPSGNYVYVTNDIAGSSGTVSQYTIDANGALTPMTPATVGTDEGPVSVTVDPSGRYVYVANNVGTVSQYTISANGALTSMPTPTVAAGLNATCVTVDPSGRYVYVGHALEAIGYGETTVSQYTIGATGALTPMATPSVAAVSNPVSVTVDPSGRYAYVANWTGFSVSQYTIGADGALTPMATPTVATGPYPISVTVDPSGRYAYVTNNHSYGGGGSVSQYTIGADGALTPNSPATIAAQAGPFSLAISRGTVPVAAVAKYAYVTNYGNGYNNGSVSQYTISADGGLISMATPTVAAGPGSYTVTADPSGKYVYVANYEGNTVSQYTIGADGGLITMPTPTVAAGTGPYSVTVDPSGQYAYVANYNGNTISQYTIGADGALTPMATPTVAAGSYPFSVTVDPSGQYVYVTNSWGGTYVSQYTIGATGALTPMATPTVAAGATPWSVTVDPSGQYAYVTNYSDNTVSQYTIGANGELTPMTPATIAAGTNPSSVTVDPSGQHVYVANSFNTNVGTVSQYTIGPTGALTPMTPATVETGSSPYSVTVDPSGQYVYVPNTFANDVWQYTISATGELTPMTPATVAAGTTPQTVTTVGSHQ